MYAFHASEPDSRPPPVSFSPPNAPPISAPDGPMLTLAMPQSEPLADRNASASRTSVVKMHDDNPCGTSLCSSIARVEVAVFQHVQDRRKRFFADDRRLRVGISTIAGRT